MKNCLTLTPSTATPTCSKSLLGSMRILEVPPLSHNSSFYQTFSYNDHLTSQAFLLGNDTISASLNATPRNLYNIRRETREFQLKCLQSKNYKEKKVTPISATFKELQNQRKQSYLFQKNREKLVYAEEKHRLSKILSNDGHIYQTQNGSLQSTPKNKNKVSKLSFNHLRSQSSGTNFNEYSKENKCSESHCNLFKVSSKNRILSNLFPNSTENDVEDNEKKERISKKTGKDVKKNPQTGREDTEGFEKEMLEEINKEIHYKVSSKVEYLINPDYSKVKLNKRRFSKDIQHEKKELKSPFFRKARMLHISQNLERERSEKEDQNVEKKSDFDYSEEIGNFNFSIEDNNAMINKYHVQDRQNNNTKYSKDLEFEAQSLLDGIAKGKYFRVEIELSLNPHLIHVREKGTENNLLHLCILNNQPEIFSLVEKISNKLNVDLINDQNKFKRNPSEVGKSLKFFYERLNKQAQPPYKITPNFKV